MSVSQPNKLPRGEEITVSEETAPTPVFLVSSEALEAPDATPPPLTLPEVLDEDGLRRARNLLEAYYDTKLVSIEAHVAPALDDADTGHLLAATSPLARELQNLIASSGAKMPTAMQNSTEVLYRMIVPARLAAGFASGGLSVTGSAAEGFLSGVRNASHIAGHVRYVPVVGGAAAAGFGAEGAAAAAGASGMAAAVTAAAPLVLAAVAVGAAVWAEKQQRESRQRIEGHLEELQRYNLMTELNELNSTLVSVDQCTALLLDEGTIGHTAGIDGATQNIHKAVSNFESRLRTWRSRLDGYGGKVRPSQLKKDFKGSSEEAGEFVTQLRLGALALALERRLLPIQAVEAAQKEPLRPLVRFSASLRQREAHLQEIEKATRKLLIDVSHLEMQPDDGLTDQLLTRSEAKGLLRWSGRLHRLAETESPAPVASAAPVELRVLRAPNGGLRVLPPRLLEDSA
jgi:hypothetical protein